MTRTGQPITDTPFDANVAAVPPTSLAGLIALRRRLIAPLLLVSLGIFFGVSLLAGVARPFMAAKLAGALNTGYLLIGVIYLTCWIAAVLYYLVATFAIDPHAAAVRAATDRAGASHPPNGAGGVR